MKLRLRGYTVAEIAIVFWGVFCVSLVGVAIWAAVHFIKKFW